MTNVVAFKSPTDPAPRDWHASIIQNFACHRKDAGDVYWLKENAELLSILNAIQGTSHGVPHDALAPYRNFYDHALEKLRFFPQYYRFLISITLDLENLGVTGTIGRQLAEVAWHAQLPRAEISDLQRAEAGLLLARRGVGDQDDALWERLWSFAGHSATFAVPNKKVAYELTHIIFYATRYGKVPVQVDVQTRQSLEYAGIIAFLECDADVLAEVCLALRYCGCLPSQIWENWLCATQGGYHFVQEYAGGHSDAYHPYLVTHWWAHAAGREVPQAAVPTGVFRIENQATGYSPLRALSKCLYEMGDQRSGDWPAMRARVYDAMSAPQIKHLALAEASSSQFDAFFDIFARAGTAPSLRSIRR